MTFPHGPEPGQMAMCMEVARAQATLTSKMEAMINDLHAAQMQSSARFTRIETTLEQVVDTLREASAAHDALREADLSLATRVTRLEAAIETGGRQSVRYRDIVNWVIGSGGVIALGMLIYLLINGE